MGHEHADLKTGSLMHDRYHRDGKLLRCLLRRAMGLKQGAPPIGPGWLQVFASCASLSAGTNRTGASCSICIGPSGGDAHDPYRWHPNAMLNGLGSSDFNTFVSNVNRKRPGFVTEMYGWYVRPGVHFVGRQENLAEDLIEAFSPDETGRSIPTKSAPYPRSTKPPPISPFPGMGPAVEAGNAAAPNMPAMSGSVIRSEETSEAPLLASR